MENEEIIQEVENQLPEKNNTSEIENSPEVSESESNSDKAPSETIDINTEHTNTTNCLALTIQEDHKVVAVKNVFFRSIRMSWKVMISTVTLAILRLFS